MAGGGLNWLDEATGRSTRYLNDPEDSTSISANVVTTIYEDRAGVLWIGTEGRGLNRFNVEEESFTHYLRNPDEVPSNSNNVEVILEDHAGTLWVGGRVGLYRFNRDYGTFTLYPHAASDSTTLVTRVVGLYERSEEPGVLWIGTAYGGLYRLDVEAGRVTHHCARAHGP